MFSAFVRTFVIECISMNPQRSRQRLTFLAMLVFIPVFLLAGVGIYSLQQDRVLANHEARERAQILADQLRDQIWSGLTQRDSLYPFSARVIRIGKDGSLLSPPTFPLVPVPNPLVSESLNASQRDLWEKTFSRPDPVASDLADVAKPLEDFLAAHPPHRYAALGSYQWALLLAAHGQENSATQLLHEILSNYPNETTESGLPLAPLISLKLLQIESGSSDRINGAEYTHEMLGSLCSNAVFYPSILTPRLLDVALKSAQAGQTNAVIPWAQLWDNHEHSRTLYEALLPHLTTPSLDTPENKLVFPSMVWVSAMENRQFQLQPSAAPTPPKEPARAKRQLDLLEPMTPVSSTRIASWETPVENLAVPDSASHGGLILHDGLANWLAVRISQDSLSATYRFWHPSQLKRWLHSQPNPTSAKAAWVLELPREPTLAYPLLQNDFLTDISSTLTRMPPYFGIGLELAGRPIASTSTSGKSSDGFPVMATSTAGNRGEGQMMVSVYLLNSKLLLARQQTRTFIFGILIGFSVLAVSVGYMLVRRAWLKQEHVAEIKTNFVSSVSHELRAPIASIRLLAEGLDQGKVREPTRQKEYFRFIVQECRRLSSMVENVLDFSRIDQDRKEYDFDGADLEQLTGETVKVMSPCAEENGVTLELNIDRNDNNPDGVEASIVHPAADAPALQQALINLIDNAIKHSPRASKVLVRLRQCPACSPAQQNVIRWSVSDQGPGIPSREREAIFERFYRVGSELNRGTQGVGIGLSIVKHIVEAHQGRVWMENNGETGSRFIIELPI